MPASAASGLPFTPCRSQPARHFFGLLNILVCGTPEEQAAGDTSHGDRDVELRGDAEEAVFHGGLAGPLREREAGCAVVKRLDLSLKA
jgi:hypothetical protein